MHQAYPIYVLNALRMRKTVLEFVKTVANADSPLTRVAKTVVNINRPVAYAAKTVTDVTDV